MTTSSPSADAETVERLRCERGDLSGTDEQRPDEGERRQHTRLRAAIDNRGRAPEDSEDDDQRFACKQQQSGQPAGAEEVSPDPHGQKREQGDAKCLGHEIGDVLPALTCGNPGRRSVECQSE